jgi:hypothetical protein
MHQRTLTERRATEEKPASPSGGNRAGTCPVCGAHRANVYDHVRRVHHSTMTAARPATPPAVVIAQAIVDHELDALDIVDEVLRAVANGSVPTSAIRAIFTWRDATETMLAALRVGS